MPNFWNTHTPSWSWIINYYYAIQVLTASIPKEVKQIESLLNNFSHGMGMDAQNNLRATSSWCCPYTFKNQDKESLRCNSEVSCIITSTLATCILQSWKRERKGEMYLLYCHHLLWLWFWFVPPFMVIGWLWCFLYAIVSHFLPGISLL